MKSNAQMEINRVDVLIVTVGTRQVGWRCKDGVVRCFGADGDRGHPPHIDQLYRELNVERGFYQDKQSDRWSVRDLGKRYYELCKSKKSPDGDFSDVVLLLDDKIISDCVTKGLKQVILWATNQPETVAWNYRRTDTLWLAELMKAKIEATWKGVKVEIFCPMVNANDREVIREELEGLILPFALEPVSDLLEGYGRRVQLSVFECVLTDVKYGELRKRLRKRVKLEEDSVRFYPLSRHTLGQVETWGVGPSVTETPESVII